MADDGKPTATVLRIKLRHADVDTFVERFASQVTRAGVFIPTRSPKPVGVEVRFEIRLADDRAVLVGQGAVRLVRQHDPGKPRVVAGMAVELQRVSRDSREVLLRMLEVRKRKGYVDGPGGMPLPGDEPEDTTATETTAIRPIPAAPAAPTPIAAEPVAPAATAAAPAEPAPTAAAPVAPAPIAAAPPEPAPIVPEPAAPVPIAAAPSAPAALEPVSRRHRVPLDLAALAAAPPTNDVVDDDLLSWAEAQVPLADVVERARALAGADLDGELAAIVAAPLPVVDRDSARAAAGLTAPRPRRARLAPLAGVDSAEVASASAPVASAPAQVESAPPQVASPPAQVASVPAPIVDGPAVVEAAFDAETIIVPPAVDLERAAMEEAERHNARMRAAERATRERARREANDRALAERSERVRRETAERDRARRERAASVAPPPQPAPATVDPLAGLELDLDEPTPAPVRPAARRAPDETTRKVDVASLGGATRKVDAAALAAEALDAGALRASLTDGGDPDLGFLDALALDDTGRRPKLPPSRAAAHTVPRAPAPRPAAVIPPPTARPAPAPAARTPAAPRAAARPAAVIPAAQPGPAARPLPGVGPATGRKPPGPTRPVPVPSEAVDVDLDDDDEVEISIEADDS